MSLSNLKFLEAETARDAEIEAAYLSGSSLDSVFETFLNEDLKEWIGDESTGKDAQSGNGGSHRPEAGDEPQAFGPVSSGGAENAAE